MSNLIIVDDESANDPCVIGANGATVKVNDDPAADQKLHNPVVTLFNNVDNILTIQIHPDHNVSVLIEYLP